MLPVPKEYLDMLTTPHQFDFWAQVWSGTRLLDDRVRIVEGSVTGDSSQDSRYTANVTLDFDFENRLDLSKTVLNVYSGRVALFCALKGARFPHDSRFSSSDFIVPLGYYRISSMDQQDLGLVDLDLEGYEQYVVDDQFVSPRTIDQIMEDPVTKKRDDRVIPAIIRLIKESFQDDPYSSTPGSPAYDRFLDGSPYWAWHGMDVKVEVTDRAILETKMRGVAPIERDRWQLIQWFANTHNLDVYCAADGKFRIRESPGRRSAYSQFPAVWSVTSGKHGVLSTVSPSVSRDNVYNAVIAYNESPRNDDDRAVTGGTNPTGPIQGEVYENDPHSPIYWKGPFGRRPLFTTGDFTTSEMAEIEALYKLNDAYGSTSEVSLGAVPNPALEPNDLIYVQYPDGRIERHIIKSISIPLGHSGTMSIGTVAKSDLKYVTWMDLPPPPRTTDEILSSPHPGTSSLGSPLVVYRWEDQHVMWMKTRGAGNLVPDTTP